MNLGLLLGSLGKPRESEAEFKALLAVQRRVLGVEHPDSLATALQLAGAALALGRNAAAEEQYRATLAVVRRKRLAAPPWAFVRRALTCAVLALCLAADPSAGRGAPEHARVRDEPGQRSGQPGQVRRGGEGLPRQPRAQAAQARAGARVPPRRSMPPCHVRCSRALPMTPREGKRERWCGGAGAGGHADGGDESGGVAPRARRVRQGRGVRLRPQPPRSPATTRPPRHSPHLPHPHA